MRQILFYTWDMYSYLDFSIPVDSGNEIYVHIGLEDSPSSI